MVQTSSLAELIGPFALFHIASFVASEKLANTGQHLLVDGIVILQVDQHFLEEIPGLLNVKSQDGSSHTIDITTSRQRLTIVLARVLGFYAFKPLTWWEEPRGCGLAFLIVGDFSLGADRSLLDGVWVSHGDLCQ